MPLSYSQLRRYRTCPRQFEFSHVKKLPWGISEGESFGASVHVALKRWGELELDFSQGGRTSDFGLRTSGRKKKNDVRDDQIPLFAPEQSGIDRGHEGPLSVDRLVELWHQSFIFDTYPTRFEAEFARKRGEELLKQFFLWWSAAPRKVIGVEKAFSLDLDGLSVAGRLDRIEEQEGGLHIIDFKTGAPCTQVEADADLQLSLYALACIELFGRPCRALTLLYLAEDGVIERATARSPVQLKDAQTQIRLIRDRMDSRNFQPTPSVAVCRRCPYRGVCDVAAV